MMYGLSENTIKRIIQVFEEHENIDQAIIYGSRAKGNYREGSDIDLSLKGELSFDALLRIESQLDELMLPYKIDLSNYGSISNQDLIDHIDRVGKVLYLKKQSQRRD